MIPEIDVRFQGISCGKMRRYFSWENFVDVFRTFFGIFESVYWVLKFRPAVIFCKGGYVAFPVAVGGWLAGVPVIEHESDLVPGLANRMAARFASKICVSFDKSAAHFDSDKVVVTGNPVRAELASGSRDAALKISGLSGSKPVLLVMGGSQGAIFVNELIWKNLDPLLAEFEIVHICGKGKKRDDLKRDGYFALEYAADEMKDFYALSDLVITRAGANSLAELEFLGLPAILIPLVKGSRGDQIGNAVAFAEIGVAAVLDETKEMPSAAELVKMCQDLIAKNESREGVTSNAAEKIVELILSYEKT